METRTLVQLLAGMSLGMCVMVLVMLIRPGVMPAQAQEPRIFQYKIVEVTTDVGAMQRTLNENGSAGWELVAVGLGDLTSPRLVFKR